MNWFLIPLTFFKWVNIFSIILYPSEKKLLLLVPFQHENFYVDPKVHIQMTRLKTIVT